MKAHFSGIGTVEVCVVQSGFVPHHSLRGGGVYAYTCSGASPTGIGYCTDSKGNRFFFPETLREEEAVSRQCIAQKSATQA